MATIPLSGADSAGGQELLRSADVIEARYPAGDEHQYVQLWGQRTLAPGRAQGAPAHVIMQVMIDVETKEQVEHALAAVDRGKRQKPR